jgi:NAD(P)-dependent dehydrogenase (short-subunit alcohol dehydrogenase family)
MKIQTWLNKNISSLEGKTIVATGTTSGLGYETLKHLASLKANVIVGVRNTQRANEQIDELKKTYPNFNAKAIFLDLASSQKIVEFSEQVQALCPDGIDALLNNAGIFAQKKEVLSCGYEKHFFVDCLAPIILSNLLLPLLKKKQNSKLVFVSSISCLNKKVNFDDIYFKNQKGDIKTYANAKRWLTLYAFELKKILESTTPNVQVNVCHPGISATSLMHYSHGKFGKFAFHFLSFGMKCVFPSSKKASLSEVLALSTSTKYGEWIGPSGAFNVYGKPCTRKFKTKLENENISKECFDKLSNITNQILAKI